MLDILTAAIGNMLEAGFGPGSWLHPVYLLAMFPLAYFIYLRRQPDTGFWAWFFPRDIIRHSSHIVSGQLFLLNVIFKMTGILNLTAIRVLVFALVFGALGGEMSGRSVDTISLWLMTIIMFLSTDFSAYVVHRLFHQTKLIWAFHAVHHSVEVLTPLAVYRTHPFGQFINSSIAAVFSGIVLALVLVFIAPSVSLVEVAGVSILFYIFNIFGASFRHSHIWISFGPVLGRIVVSPAFHQIHHSLETKHWNKNYGNMLAIWDWMFGTMYLPGKEEKLEFGLSFHDGSRIPQPHPTFLKALWVPFRDSFRYFHDGSDPAFPPQEGEARTKLAPSPADLAG